VIKAIADDISAAIAANNPPKWFLGLPETIYDRVWDHVDAGAKGSLFHSVKKDLVKTDKNDLIDIFKKKLS
jgi:hypothetical protein